MADVPNRTPEQEAAILRLIRRTQEEGSTATLHTVQCGVSRREPCDCEPLVFTVCKEQA